MLVHARTGLGIWKVANVPESGRGTRNQFDATIGIYVVSILTHKASL